MKMQRTLQRVVGFTLIELMVVIAIIGILAAVAIPQYQTYTIRAAAKHGISAIRPIQIAVNDFFSTNAGLPSGAGDLDTIAAFDEASTCSGYVQSITYAPGAADANTGLISDGVFTVTFYTDNGPIDNNCQIDAAGVADVPKAISGKTLLINAKILGNGNLEWEIDMAANNGTLAVEYRPTL